MEGSHETAFALLMLGWALFVIVYLVPSLVAILRHHHQAAAIVVLNLLLGWTFLGWVLALVWSMTAVQRR